MSGRCILFLLNSRGYGYEYGCDCGGCGSCTACCEGNYNAGMPWANNSGLFNSCAFVVDMMNAAGMPSRLIQINGATGIAEKVEACHPTDVVIEAIFVPPQILGGLVRAYPNVHWYVRIHSEIPFLVQEGQALNWLYGYLLYPSVSIAANSFRARSDLQVVAAAFFPHWDQATLDHRVLFLPNYYPAPAALPHIPSPFGTLNIGCLGAIRTLKNQVLQAVAAISLAAQLNKKLLFHINSSRIEGGAPSILTNLRALFANSVNAALVEHPWMPRSEFLRLCRTMDLGMQVSFSETFNIVSADFATNNVPLLVSPEVSWCDARIQAGATSTSDMVNKAKIALRAVSITEANRRGLLAYNETSQFSWHQVFGELSDSWTDQPASFKARPALTSRRTHM
jgi:hypothetical protein